MEAGKNKVYKIEIGDVIPVYRSENQGKIFYKAQVLKKNYDNTKSKYYKILRFRRGIDIPNGTKIRINDMFEDVRENPKDKYNSIWSLFITDFTELRDEILEQQQAMENYRDNLVETQESDDFYGLDSEYDSFE